MLRNVTDLRGYAIRATDGVIGRVDDVYFDDEDWAIRYLIVDAGGWLSGRRVLISPIAVGHPDWLGQLLPVSLTKAQIKGSPDIDTQKPVSRQDEADYFRYYAYPYYWGSGGLWGMGAYPGSLTTEDRVEAAMKAHTPSAAHSSAASHLRSCNAVMGLHLHAADGEIGHVEDFLVDERTWAIRYLVVDTSNWWGGHRVLIAPRWITAISWGDRMISVDVTREAVKSAPAYDSASHLDRQQEQSIFEHHGRPDYWTTKAVRDTLAPSAK